MSYQGWNNISGPPIHTLLHEQLSLEFFIEGGRSRSGALLPPMAILGLLGAILDFHSAPLAELNSLRTDPGTSKQIIINRS